MVSEVETVPICTITIGPRRRADYGDVDALARSLTRYGLIQPIAITDDGRLIAGERRLRAAMLAGWGEIEAVNLGDLTDEQIAEMEVEENTQRKDLTAYELSKQRVEEARRVAAELATRVSADSAETGNHGGRPSVYGVARADVADALGIGEARLREAEQHVAAVEQYPHLANQPQSVAVEYARAVEEQPDLAAIEAPPRDIVDVARQRREAARERARVEQEQANAILDFVGDPEGKIARAALRRDVATGISALRSKLLSLPVADVVAVLDESDVQALRWAMRDARAWFDEAEKALGTPLRAMKGH